jgi:hypothetical protein
MLTPSLPHMHFFYFNDICYLSSNGSSKSLESIVTFYSFLEAALALILEFYESEELAN